MEQVEVEVFLGELAVVRGIATARADADPIGPRRNCEAPAVLPSPGAPSRLRTSGDDDRHLDHIFPLRQECRVRRLRSTARPADPARSRT